MEEAQFMQIYRLHGGQRRTGRQAMLYLLQPEERHCAAYGLQQSLLRCCQEMARDQPTRAP
eukprot:656545-Hanusia_phi.AAC.1